MKNQKGVTHTGRLRGQYRYNKFQVLYLTGMTVEQLHEFQFNMGCEWLMHYTSRNRDFVDTMMREKLVWDWWKNEWYRTDVELLPRLYEVYGEDIRDWLASVDFNDEGDVLVMEGGDMVMNGLDEAESEIRKTNVLAEYRMAHQACFMRYSFPYRLLGKDWERLVTSVEKYYDSLEGKTE